MRGGSGIGLQGSARISFVDGIKTILTEGVTPPLFSPDSMSSVRKIVRALGTNGVSALDIAIPELQRSVELSSAAEANVQSLVRVHHKSIGSVEGKLELISVHVRSRRFNVYHAITQRAIKCNLPKGMEEEVVRSLGRRVIVSGLVSYNVRGEPLNVNVDHLRVLKDGKVLPSIDDMLGMAPDITGELTTEEYIRRLRDG